VSRWPLALLLVLVAAAIAKGGWTYYVADHDATMLRVLAGYCADTSCVVRFHDGEIKAVRAELACPQGTPITTPQTRF